MGARDPMKVQGRYLPTFIK